MGNILPWEPQGWLWSNKLLSRTVPFELISNFISSSNRILGDTDECQSGGWRVHGCTGGDVLTACRPFRTASLSEQILKYFCDLITFLTS